eukprot:jgi/Chrzof1/11100/Cz05g23190.t1
MSRLVYLEEIQHTIDIQQYNMQGTTLVLAPGGGFWLQVPGLAENRPSVLRGDSVYVVASGSPAGTWEHVVNKEEVG